MNLLPLAFRISPLVEVTFTDVQAEQLNQLPDVPAEMILLGVH